MTGYAFTDFEAVLDAIQGELAAIAPQRLVTRDFKDFTQHPRDERQNGVFTILPGPRTGYSYEYRPGDLPRCQIFVYGELTLPGDPKGREIDAAEAAMARDLEQLANQAPETNGLEELVLESITGSAQTLRPTASILAVFVYGVDR
ncbi:MAG: hypothetical protein ACOC0Q_07265 [Wenzhouxiangella sp.]